MRTGFRSRFSKPPGKKHLMTNTPFARATAFALVLTAVASAQSRIQFLHASDLEGGIDAIADAPNFAAIVGFLEDDAATGGTPSVLLSSGDNYIPGPFFNAAAQSSLRTTIQDTLFPSTPTNFREGEGRIDISIMNLMGFDAAAVGNHEFDVGAGTFAGLIGTDIRGPATTDVRWLGAQFPYLSANLDFTGEADLDALFTVSLLQNTAFQSPITDLVAAENAPKLARATLVERRSELIGVVGATTQVLESITSNDGVSVIGPTSNDMPALAALIQPEIDACILAGANKILLISHLQQFALEQALTPLLSGVDIVFAGGSDTISADPQDRLRSGDTADQPYPLVTTNLDGDPALIVSTSGQYKYVGRLVVDFDASGIVVPGSVDQIESGAFATDAQGVTDLFGATDPFATAGAPADVKTLTDAVSSIVTAADGNVFGRTDVFLEGRRGAVRTEETNLSSLTADANLALARQFDPSVLVSHKNGGGIRAPIGTIDPGSGATGPTSANPLAGKNAGDVSQLDIENTLRFNNGLTLITVTRAQLKEVIEHAVAATAVGATPGQFGQFAGVSFSFDPAREAGDRVRSASLTQPGVFMPNFIVDGAVVGTSPIRMVTLDFLAGGGDDYPFEDFLTANPGFANRVDLEGASGVPAGVASFATDGSEQDALAEYFAANFATSPFAKRDASIQDDQRIQQIGTRPTHPIDAATPGVVTFGVNGAPNSLVSIALAVQAAELQTSLGLLGVFSLGVQGTPVPVAFTDANGEMTLPIPVPPGLMLELTSQAVVINPFGPSGIAIHTTESTTFIVQ